MLTLNRFLETHTPFAHLTYRNLARLLNIHRLMDLQFPLDLRVAADRRGLIQY